MKKEKDWFETTSDEWLLKMSILLVTLGVVVGSGLTILIIHLIKAT